MINDDLWVVAPYSLDSDASSMLSQKTGANTHG